MSTVATSDLSTQTKFSEHLCTLLRSGTQAMQIVTNEESRLLEDIHEVMNKDMVASRSGKREDRTAARPVIVYDYAHGWHDALPTESPVERCVKDPSLALQMLLDEKRFPLASSDNKESLVHSTCAGNVLYVGPLLDEHLKLQGVQEIDANQRRKQIVVVGNESLQQAFPLPETSGAVVWVGEKIKPGELLAKPFAGRLFVFKDLGFGFNSDAGLVFRRVFRTLFENKQLATTDAFRQIIFTGPVRIKHVETAYALTEIEYGLPTVEHLRRAVDYMSGSLRQAGYVKQAEVSPAFREALAQSLTGLTQTEALDALAYASDKNLGFNHDEAGETKMLHDLYELQRQNWASDDVLELYDTSLADTAEDFGGFDLYVNWLTSHVAPCLSPEARRKGIRPAKGCVLLGVPGTGKSRIAMATARILRLPLVIFKIESVFHELVGSSESRVRKSLERISAKGRCVVLLDEADKSLGGLNDAHSGDSGVGKRVLTQLLSWQANTNQDAFVIATMNRARGIPPEMMRAGRFDRIYYTDLPTLEERQQILNIHLRKAKIPADTFTSKQLGELATLSKNMVGAEIEQFVVDATRTAFSKSKGETVIPSFAQLRESMEDTKSISKFDPAGIKEILDFCRDKARPVSASVQSNLTGGKQANKRGIDLGTTAN